MTRGPSLDPHDKRLAVHIEDHPLDYGDFEGTIPKGEYGGGTVMLWDEGTWEPVGDPEAGLAKGDLKFILHGERLKGKWVLVRMKPRKGERSKHENWLLIKERDEYADRGDEADHRAGGDQRAHAGARMERDRRRQRRVDASPGARFKKRRRRR